MEKISEVQSLSRINASEFDSFPWVVVDRYRHSRLDVAISTKNHINCENDKQRRLTLARCQHDQNDFKTPTLEEIPALVGLTFAY